LPSIPYLTIFHFTKRFNCCGHGYREIAVAIRLREIKGATVAVGISRCVRTTYSYYSKSKIHPALVSCPFGIPEKVNINEKGINKKLYSHQK
jgi:hypothetical protein